MHIQAFKRGVTYTFDEYKGVRAGDTIHLRNLPEKPLICLTFFTREGKVYAAYNDDARHPNKVRASHPVSEYEEFAETSECPGGWCDGSGILLPEVQWSPFQDGVPPVFCLCLKRIQAESYGILAAEIIEEKE